MWKKCVAFSILLALVVLLSPTPTPAQPGGKGGKGSGGAFPAPPGGPGGEPGGFGRRPEGGGPGGTGGPPSGFGGRSRGMDPESSWGMLQRLTGSSGDTVDLGKIPPQTLTMMRGMAERSGTTPLPESGIMTKAAFLEHHARNEAARAERSATSGSPGGFGPPGGGFGPPGGGFGPPGGSGDEDYAARRIREQDKNGDGKISMDEADSRLRSSFKNLDSNGDGYIDLSEYQKYADSRNSGGDQGGRDQRSDDRKQVDEERPVAMRYGKLPQGLPGWYNEYDTDKDGQVGLYEWRLAKKSIPEFMEMDLNGDGLITADEYLRFTRQKSIDTKVAAYESGEREPGNWGLGAKLDSTGDPSSKGKGGFGGWGGKGGDKGSTPPGGFGGWGGKGGDKGSTPPGGFGGWGGKGGDKGDKGDKGKGREKGR